MTAFLSVKILYLSDRRSKNLNVVIQKSIRYTKYTKQMLIYKDKKSGNNEFGKASEKVLVRYNVYIDTFG